MMRTMLLTAGLLAGLATPAFAHENGVIRLASKSLALGAELAMRGEKLPKNATLRLELRGALSTFALGTVSTDSAGTFQLGRSLPPDVRAGSYVVVAIAPDGDKVAQADLSITPAPAPDAMAAMPGMAGHATATTAGGDAGPPGCQRLEQQGFPLEALSAFIGGMRHLQQHFQALALGLVQRSRAPHPNELGDLEIAQVVAVPEQSVALLGRAFRVLAP